MKKDEIRVGGLYLAKVSGVITTVRVDRIQDDTDRMPYYKSGVRYDVTNLRTGRRTTFRSAAKFRCEAKPAKPVDRYQGLKDGTVKPDGLTEECIAAGTDWYTGQETPTPFSGNSGSAPSADSPDGWAGETAVPEPTKKVIGFGENLTPTSDMPPVEHVHQGDSPEPLEIAEQVTEDEVEEERQAAVDKEFEDDYQSQKAEERQEGEQRSDPTTTSGAPTATNPELAVTATSFGLARRIAASRSTQSTVPDTVAGYAPTDEQRAVLEAVLEVLRSEGPQVLVIEAGAGAGKTSTLKMLEAVLPGRGQYTAFNKSLVEDSRPKFQKAKCNTTHSLAFAPCGRDYQHRLPGQGNARVRSDEVARMLGLQDYKVDTGAKNEREEPVVKVLRAGLLAGYIRQALRKFAQSAEREIGPEHFPYIDGIDQQTENKRRGYSNNNAVRGYLLPFARAAWEDVGRRDGTFPFEHDFYVKLWQLQDSPTIGADYILLDEDQDTAPVFADVIRRQTSSLLVLVGDENQAIYEWRGACNASKLFPDAPVRRLTQSFRFGQSVADVANAVLGELDGGTELRMRGVGIPSRVLLGSDKISGLDGETDRADQYVGKVCYLYRTNAGAVGSLLQENGRGRRGCLIGKIDEVLSFVEGALDLQRGRRTGNPELAVFESWKEVQKYVKEDPDGEDLKLMVRLVDDFGAENIIRALKNMPEERYADFVASTAHKSKGREWDTVVLGADFPPACDMADPDRRLLYVAATRAKYILDLTQCTPFHEYTDREGNVTKGILVTFTQGNPERGQLADWLAARSAATAAAAAPPASPGPSPAVPAQDAAVPRVGPANGVPAAQAEPPPAPSGEAIRAMVAATEERVVTYAKLPNSSEWGMWASAEIRPGEVVEIRTRSGAIKREKVGQIVLVAPKKWLATIAR